MVETILLWSVTISITYYGTHYLHCVFTSKETLRKDVRDDHMPHPWAVAQNRYATCPQSKSVARPDQDSRLKTQE
jgi:hypothetical protein